MSPTFQRPKALCLQRQPQYPGKGAPRRKKHDHCATIKFPLATESAMKNTEDSNTLVSLVDVKANKHQIQAHPSPLHSWPPRHMRTGKFLPRYKLLKHSFVTLELKLYLKFVSVPTEFPGA
ncbi:large ribosomal subunit protein uL23-like [Oryctolagus cuniculus]|uniref:large ribosomal subunit protein uL23-like n=1 Tax=Oryctolagus cuniculus TaxID=9986 RepID=UPI0038792180